MKEGFVLGMEFTLYHVDIFLLILVRVTGFIFVAPFFSLKNVPMRVKAGISCLLAIVLFNIVPYQTFNYASNYEYIFLIAKEVILGLMIGFFANIGYYILALVGHMIDTEIGFSMVSTLDPVTNIQVTITSNLYTYLVMLMMMVTNLHHYFIKAFVDTYEIIPLGEGVINPNLYSMMVAYMTNYFIIGFRIVIPIFGAILIVNVTLGILAKVAPQMNMFVIGMQLKVFVGLIMLYFVVQMLPAVSDFIFNQMLGAMKDAIYALKG